MRKFPLLAAALLLSAGPAMAQGDAVTVNPAALGNRPLLYPGGEFMRLQRPLLQPGQRNPNAPIQLRRPGARSAARTTPAQAPVAAATPAPRPQQVARAEPAPARTTQPPASVANGNDEFAAWNKSGLIEFLPAQGEVHESRMDAVKFLAGSLNNSLSASASSRVEIIAYGGARGDKGSDARRLSLRRALSVRQILIDSGVSKDRIGVRAMGGADDGGPADRVDVYVHS